MLPLKELRLETVTISEQTLIRITSKNKQAENTSLTMKKYILQLLLLVSFGYCMTLPAKSQGKTQL